MGSAVETALRLIFTGSRELMNILSTTARVSLTSSLAALLLGVPLGLWLGTCRFPGRGALIVINRTLMGLPPVVCGLVIYLLFSGVGPFRHLKLIFTVPIMILAQVVLITPIVTGTIETFAEEIAPPLRETARGLGLPPLRRGLLLLNESVHAIVTVYLLAFARAIAEVGAVSMVGGAIAWKTNVMTTAIMQYTNMGNFSMGIALGLILMAISLCINLLLTLLQRRMKR